MNYIWGIMIIVGVIYGILTGQVNLVSDAVLDSAREAVTLCITMLGVMALWMGLMEIARDAGLITSLSKRIRPLIHFLFPNIPKDHPAEEQITLNFVANFLGLGWAATPAGLKAMEALAELEEERRNESEHPAGIWQDSIKTEVWEDGNKQKRKEWSGGKVKQMSEKREKGMYKPWRKGGMPRGVASNEMCNFLILNISSLQLIPVNIIAYRSQYGSVNPTAIVGPGILATAVSTGVAIVFCKVMDQRKRRA